MIICINLYEEKKNESTLIIHTETTKQNKIQHKL